MSKLVDFTTQTGDVIKVSELMVDDLNGYLERFPKYPVIKRVYLFGSTLEERCNEESDIDMYMVYDGRPLEFYDSLGEMYMEFDVVLRDDILCCSVDELVKENSRGFLGKIINKGAKVIYDSM